MTALVMAVLVARSGNVADSVRRKSAPAVDIIESPLRCMVVRKRSEVSFR